MKQMKFYVDKACDGERLDRAILGMAKDLSRKKIRAIIDIGGVYVNRKRVRFASRPVRAGDCIEMQYNPEALQKLKRQNFALKPADILFHQHGLVAIHKPPGLPSQPTRDQSIVHVCAVVEKYFKDKGQNLKGLQILHRLDKETSGVMLLAHDNTVAAKIMADFKSKAIAKTYHAVCRGIPTQKKFAVECYLSAIDKKSGLVKKVRSGGKPSFTDFELLASNEKLNLSLICCYPKTGRSHQIRVHLQEAGYPILGDKKYGKDMNANLPQNISTFVGEHHFLHAETIRVSLLDNKPITITASYPENFQRLVAEVFSSK